MNELIYEAELKDTLIKYGKLVEEETLIKNEKERIRNMIINWMDLNKLSNHQVLDNDNQMWSLDKYEIKKTSIDKDKLRHLINEDLYNSILTNTVSHGFKCQRIKSNKSNKSNKPTAPKVVS